MSTSIPAFLSVGEGADQRDIAFRAQSGASPSLVWLGGYRSDMLGTKAEAIQTWAVENGAAFLRHDYSGHGESGGEFSSGTISRWLEESLAVFDHCNKDGSAILVGSSMGAWVALRMVQELNERDEAARVHALLLLAPAPDFTRELMLPELTEDQRKQLNTRGYFEEHSEYSDEPNIFTRNLLEDGEKNRVLTGQISTNCPVHVIQGMKDPDVPYQHAMKLVSFLPDENVTMTLVKDGDHRLSRPEDLQLMIRTIENLRDGKQ